MATATGDATATLDETIRDGQVFSAQNEADLNAKANLVYNQTSVGTKSLKTLIVDGVGNQVVAIGGGNVVEVSGGRTKLTGSGANEALLIAGGGTSGGCIVATAGAPNGTCIVATGDGTGQAVTATGGDNSGTAVSATGGAPNGVGISAVGTGTGNAITATGKIVASSDITGRRYKSTGTAVGSGNFVMVGWGATATQTAHAGDDTAWFVTFTSQGGGQTANPTITFSFADGTYTTAPGAIVVLSEYTVGALLPFVWTVAAASLVVTFTGTLVNGDIYKFRGMTIGH